MLYFHAVRGADAGAKFNNPRGAVRTQQNIPKPHRVRAVRLTSLLCDHQEGWNWYSLQRNKSVFTCSPPRLPDLVSDEESRLPTNRI